MRTRAARRVAARYTWDRLKVSFWFAPVIMSLVAILLAWALFIRQGEIGAHYYDLDRQLRLILEPVTFEELLDAAFDMLRHASCDNASVMLHMLGAIDVIGRETKSFDARQLLKRQVSLIQAESQAGRLIEDDRRLIHRTSEAVVMNFSGT